MYLGEMKNPRAMHLNLVGHGREGQSDKPLFGSLDISKC